MVILIPFFSLRAEGNSLPYFIKGTEMKLKLEVSNEGVKFRSGVHKFWPAEKLEIIIRDNQNKTIYSTKLKYYLPPREKKEIILTCVAPQLSGTYSIGYILRSNNNEIVQLERPAGKFVVGELLPDTHQQIKAKKENQTSTIESQIPSNNLKTPTSEPPNLEPSKKDAPKQSETSTEIKYPSLSSFEQDIKTAPSIQTPESSYIVRQGDVLEIFVLEDEALRRQVIVTPDGFISFPVIGSLLVSGLTTSEVSRRITALLKEKRYLINPSVTVSVIEGKGRNFSILGEVRKPGVYPLEEGTTILVAISQAEGYTEFADIRNIKIIRKENIASNTVKIIKINLKKTMKIEQADIVILPKDIIIVPEKFWR